jgi:pentatricopeptide repeat protein
MIEGCVETKDMGLAIQLSEEMQCKGIEPNEATYLSVSNALYKGMFLHGQVIELLVLQQSEWHV